LGCVNNNSLVLGSSSTHSPPSPDCGWSSGASNARFPFNKACTAVYNSGTCSGIWDTVVVGFGWSPCTFLLLSLIIRIPSLALSHSRTTRCCAIPSTCSSSSSSLYLLATCESFARAYNGYAGSRLVCTFDYFQVPPSPQQLSIYLSIIRDLYIYLPPSLVIVIISYLATHSNNNIGRIFNWSQYW